MRILANKSAPCHESKMQNELVNLLSDRYYAPPETSIQWQWENPKVYTEIHIPQIGRRSDIIMLINGTKSINIECKMKDYGVVFQQAIDHLKWCDYSYICLMAETNLPSYMLKKILDTPIGLILWKPGMFTEVIQSSYNAYNGIHGKDKKIKTMVLETLKKRDHESTGTKENKNQVPLF